MNNNLLIEKRAKKYSKPSKSIQKYKNKKLKNLNKAKPIGAKAKRKMNEKDDLKSVELLGKKGKLIQDKNLKESFQSLYDNFMNSTKTILNN